MMRRTCVILWTLLWACVPLGAQTPAASDLAARVQVGVIPCELGAMVDLQVDPKANSQFLLKHGKDTFHMRPVLTSTGVVRLEDSKTGAVWLQISNKSMLMNQKLGRRLADECMTPEQAAVALALKSGNAPGLLDTPSAAVVASPVASPSVATRPQAGSTVQTRAGPLQSRDGLVQAREGQASALPATVASAPSAPKLTTP